MFDKMVKKSHLFSNRVRLITEKNTLLTGNLNNEEITEYQLRRLNEQWKVVRVHPFYQKLFSGLPFPESFKSLNEIERYPSADRKFIRSNQHLLFHNVGKHDVVATGGSTGEPRKLPVYGIEKSIQYANAYCGRSWWGIRPFDRIALLWGHSHLFGGGLAGKLKQTKRRIINSLIKTLQLNAYNLNEETMDCNFEQLRHFQPIAIIGYTSAIIAMCRYLQRTNKQVLIASLKAVIMTSETICQSDIELVESVFRVPAVTEYGMVETGVIGYSYPDLDTIRFFWDSFLLQNSNAGMLVTTLYPRAFPLFRYETGDSADGISSYDSSIRSVTKISGRTNDIFILLAGSREVLVQSIFLQHIIKSINEIDTFFIRQTRNDKRITISYTGSLDESLFSKVFFERLIAAQAGVSCEQFTFSRVDDIPKTIAGKRKWVEVVDE